MSRNDVLWYLVEGETERKIICANFCFKEIFSWIVFGAEHRRGCMPTLKMKVNV